MGNRTILACLFVFCLAFPGASQENRGLPQAVPEAIGLRPAQLSHIDDAVAAAIQARETPGAVVLVARHGKIGYWKAFAFRALQPQTEAMTTDTIFDMASLTKVLATTPAIMLLAQNGRLRIGDKVKRYLPLFTGGGKDDITVRQLLTHCSGLPADFDLSRPWEGREAALEELWRLPVQTQPGKEFLYSDLNFIALGEIVRAVSGESLDVFTQQEVYQPLGMSETGFKPPESWLERIAPTESRERSLQYLKGIAPASAPGMLRGEVHDPTAWRMGGVAGHAGLFSSARDVAIYAQMLLDHGNLRGSPLLSASTVQAMTSPQSPGGLPVRGYGWDIDTAYSAPRGDLWAGGYGHTGFTGTSLWIHPPTETFIIILTNRLHPDGKGDVTHLRGVIANIVAAAIADRD
ncbi:MAG: serine hydrolase [Acidobacteriia bacterium]|nr:serine hydrolase [Terriglobia bacterium]